MMAIATALTARIAAQVVFRRDPAQFECFGDVLVNRVLDGMHFLLRVEKSARDGILQQGVAVLFKIRDFHAFQRLRLGLLFLKRLALAHHRFVLASGIGVGQKGVNAFADGNLFRLVNDDLTQFLGLFFNFCGHKFYRLTQ